MKTQYQLPCNIAQTLNLIGDKWTLLIIHAILVGKSTYKELQEELKGIPTNLLSQRLKSLEEDGLLMCELYQNHPPRYRYSLTDDAKELDDVFYAIILWGEKHLKKCYKKVVHTACDHDIEQRYYCTHCGKLINKDEISVHMMEE